MMNSPFGISDVKSQKRMKDDVYLSLTAYYEMPYYSFEQRAPLYISY
jgi:hypothetical protein